MAILYIFELVQYSYCYEHTCWQPSVTCRRMNALACLGPTSTTTIKPGRKTNTVRKHKLTTSSSAPQNDRRALGVKPPPYVQLCDMIHVRTRYEWVWISADCSPTDSITEAAPNELKVGEGGFGSRTAVLIYAVYPFLLWSFWWKPRLWWIKSQGALVGPAGG